jgi:membrane associated rhomboid family serine protease
MAPRRGAAPFDADFGGMFSRPPQATLAIMIATLALSVLAMASGGRFGDGTVVRLLLFSPAQVYESFKVWTPFTYLFVEVGPQNLLFHELVLWMFAAPLERSFGVRRFLFYFFTTGAGAALLTAAISFAVPDLRAVPFRGTYVASEALVLGWVLMHWTSTVYLLVFPVRAPFLLIPALGVPFLYIIQGAWEVFTPVLLGMGIGYLLLRRGLSPRRAYLHFRAWWIDRQLRRKSRHLKLVASERPKDPGGPGKYLH